MINPKRFDPATLPFLACIETVFPSRTTVGTGTLIGPKLILTAGHVVFDPNFGGDAVRFRVTLGNPRRAFFSVTVRETTRQWTDRDSMGSSEQRALANSDVAVVVLDDPIDTLVPTQVVETTESEVLQAATLNVAGYSPRDFPNIAHFASSSGLVMDPNRHRISYPVRTVAGMSGGPVWTNFTGERVIRAIHTSIVGGMGNALRITAPVLRLIEGWRSKFHPSSETA